MDVVDLNEVFSAQGLAVLWALGLEEDDRRINNWGGAIVLGHPVDASAARMVSRAVIHLHAAGALCASCRCASA